MASKYQMQAYAPLDGTLKSWLSVAPDWAAIGFPGPGIPDGASIALTGGGLDNSGGGDTDDVSVVAIATLGAYAVSASGAWATTNRKIAISAGGATAVSASGAWAVTR